MKKLKSKDKETIVGDHLERFKLQIRGRRGKNPRQLSENELWALGQHYGLHTPLLDWSQSPFVGLFFALASPKESGTGFRTLWALNAPDIKEISSWYKKKSAKSQLTVELINPILDENERLVNQNGLFTKAPLTTDIEKWVSNGPNFEWTSLYRIDFPDKIRDEAIAYLDLMNINYASLYPDLVGSSLDSNTRLEQTDYLQKMQADQWKEINKMKKFIDKESKL